MSNTKLAIVGMAPTWTHAPFDDPTYDLWGFNHLFLDLDDDQLSRFTAWFELHNPDHFVAKPSTRRLWLREVHPFDLYLHDQEIADEYGGIPFPKREIEFGFRRGGYHASSFDWLLACALLPPKQYDRIDFYGLYGLTSGEPPSARACLEYWCGVAEGQGVDVHVPNETEVLMNTEMRGGQYAYSVAPDGLGVTYLRDGIEWRDAPEMGMQITVGHKGSMCYVGFPALQADYTPERTYHVEE